MANTRIGEIIEILQKVGTERCLTKAETLEKESPPLRSLNLRNLNLDAAHVIAIANSLNQENEIDQDQFKSISFSYNTLLGDAGAIALAKNMSKEIFEIGLVNCGIGDQGGSEILNWMKASPKLRMICMEQNNFSEKLIIKFENFRSINPQVMVVF